MKKIGQAVYVNVALAVLSIFSIYSRLPSLRLGLPPHIFVDEIFFFDDVYRNLKSNYFYPQAFISGAVNETPMWVIGKTLWLFGIRLDYGQFLVLGRLLLPVLLTSITVFPLYFLSLRVNKSQIAAFTTVLLFVSSPWIFANSQIWYPDHYIYFFVALYLLQLTKLWDGEIDPRLPLKIGISLGLLISVKYTAGIYLLPLLMISKNVEGNRNSKWYLGKKGFRSLLFACSTFLIINFSIFKYFHGFLAGMNSNRKNYRFLTNFPLPNLVAYSELLLVFGLGFIGLGLTLLGIIELRSKNSKYLGYMMITTLFYLILLSTSPILVPRNINLFIPLLAVIAGASSNLLLKLYKKNKLSFYATLLICTSLLFPSIRSSTESYTEIRRTESFQLAVDFINKNVPRGAEIGTNPGSDGIFPVDTLRYTSVSDPAMKSRLKYYVFSSYWESPVRQYFSRRSYFAKWSVRDLHFDQSSAQNALILKDKQARLAEYLPDGYRIAKVISSVGPSYVVLVHN